MSLYQQSAAAAAQAEEQAEAAVHQDYMDLTDSDEDEVSDVSDSFTSQFANHACDAPTETPGLDQRVVQDDEFRSSRVKVNE